MKRLLAQLLFLCVVAAPPAVFAQAGSDLALPPPPSDFPPSIDIAMLTPAPADADYALLPAQGVEDESAFAAPLPAVGMPSMHPAMPPASLSAFPPASLSFSPSASVASPAPARDVAVDAILNDLKSGGDARSKLETMLVAQLRERLPDGGQDLIIEGASIPNVAKLPADGWKPYFRFRMPQTATGQVSYTCEVGDPSGKILKQFSGAVRLDREVKAVQATRSIARGEIVNAQDFQTVSARLSELPAGTIQSADDIVGSAATTDMRPYQWVSDRMVKRPDVIARNTPVRLLLKRGSLTLTTPGIALQGGAKGDIVRAVNADSKKEVFARIVSSDEVQVVF